MGRISEPAPVVVLLAVISRYDEALAWTVERAASVWGPVALRSETFAFCETDYYESTMGANLGKTFLAFERLADAGEVGPWKHRTNAWEAEYAAWGRHPEPRPLNLDPGYITLAKLVLASTKDHAHRLYLGGGMFAEVTLSYKSGRWQEQPWTFPDYRRSDYQAFFGQVRDFLRVRARGVVGDDTPSV